MKTNNFLTILSLCYAALGFTSCNNNEECTPGTPDTEVGYTYRMKFDATCQPFDGDTRATVVWEDGARVHLSFADGNAQVSGQATYEANSREWTIYVSKALSSAGGQCEAVYFDAPSALTDAQATLSMASVVFTDMQASYEIAEDMLVVHASLSPKTGRIRFKGTAGEKFSVTGLSYYNAYTFASRTYSSEQVKLSATIGNDGYTGFYHVFFTDDRSLVFDNTATTCFKSTFATSTLAAGMSGFVTIPTADNPGYWTLVNKDNLEPITLPELGKVQLVRAPYSSSAMLSTSLVSDGNGHISESGVVWSQSATPTLSDHKVTASPDAMTNIALSGLTPQTTYYVRAFATNEKGTAYGEQLTFTTTEKAPDTDITAGGYDEENNWDKQ